MKLFVPSIGSIIFLEEDWTFKLYFERRNSSLTDVFKNDVIAETEKAMTDEELENSYSSFSATRGSDKKFLRVTIPKGTQLAFDRLYIRRGSEAFNSVTFRVKSSPEKKLKGKRFWAKLPDVNNIMCNVVI
jgi:hypothetical protein